MHSLIASRASSERPRRTQLRHSSCPERLQLVQMHSAQPSELQVVIVAGKESAAGKQLLQIAHGGRRGVVDSSRGSAGSGGGAGGVFPGGASSGGGGGGMSLHGS